MLFCPFNPSFMLSHKATLSFVILDFSESSTHQTLLGVGEGWAGKFQPPTLGSNRRHNYPSYNSSFHQNKEKVALSQVERWHVSNFGDLNSWWQLTTAHSTVLLKTSSSYPLTKGRAEQLSEEGSSKEGQPPPVLASLLAPVYNSFSPEITKCMRSPIVRRQRHDTYKVPIYRKC